MSKADEKSLRREYSRLRATAKKRLDRLNSSGFGDTDFVRQWEFDIVPLKEIKNYRQLVHARLAVERFLENPYSRVSVQKEVRRKILKTISKNVGNMVNEENLADFGRFMETAREKAGQLKFDSQSAYDVFNDYVSRHGNDINLHGLKSVYGRWKSENT